MVSVELRHKERLAPSSIDTEECRFHATVMVQYSHAGIKTQRKTLYTCGVTLSRPSHHDIGNPIAAASVHPTLAA